MLIRIVSVTQGPSPHSQHRAQLIFLCLGFEINWNKSSTQPLQWVEFWRSCSAHSFAAGAAWRHSDSADCYTGAGVHSSGSSSGTTGVATHATPAEMDARTGTSGALDFSLSSMQGDVCCWGGGLVQESGDGSVHRPIHLLPAMVFSGASGRPTLGRGHVPWPKKLFCALPPLRLTPPLLEGERLWRRDTFPRTTAGTPTTSHCCRQWWIPPYPPG